MRYRLRVAWSKTIVALMPRPILRWYCKPALHDDDLVPRAAKKLGR